MPHHEDDATLRDLWSRRNSLNESEWTHLYGIVVAALKSYRPEILSSLSEDHDVYVTDFFQDKVYRPDLLSRLKHVGAIRVAYNRYLHDRYDSEKVRRTEDLTEEDPDGRGTRATADPRANGAPDREDEFKLFSDAGMSLQVVSESAARWLRNAEPWVPTMLGLHFCADREDSESLNSLRKRLKISSHHYKAEKLGITGVFDQEWGERTIIGRWLTAEIGIAITEENHPLVLTALKILCFEALIWAEEQEAAP